MELLTRLDSVIKKDKQINPQYMLGVIKSDIYELINNYFEVQFSDINISIDLTENNMYKLNINALGDRPKTLKILPHNTSF